MSQPLHTILFSFIRQWPLRIVMAIAFTEFCSSSFAATAPDANAIEAAKTAQEAEMAGKAGAAKDAAHGEKHEKHHGLSADAPKLWGTSFINNSMIATWIVALLMIFFAQRATEKIRSNTNAANEVPEGAQNFWEFLIEGLHNFLSEIMGRVLAKKTFWFFCTIFIFILATNWFGLLPGVGTIGWGTPNADGSLTHLTTPLFRGGNADLNMTSAMAVTFFVWWIIWALAANGPIGFFKHIFAPKGKDTGAMKVAMIVIFGIVGVLEVISIVFRPVALSFRLYGNIFAGETMLESMQQVVPALAWLIPVPFYFMELLVGLVQALVFMLLTSVFTLLICEHEEGHEEHGEDHHDEKHPKPAP